jgi:hypothetical protein
MGVWRVSGDRKIDLTGLINLANNNFFMVSENTHAEIALWADVDPAYEGTITHHLELHEYYKG